MGIVLLSPMSSSPRRSLRLAGKEPEITVEVPPPCKKSRQSQEAATEWKRLSLTVPRMDNCLLFGKFLAATLSTVATVAASYNWSQAKI